MPAEEMSVLEGEVIALETEGARVRLSDGRMGWLPSPIAPVAGLRSGFASHFRIDRQGPAGEPVLSIVPTAPQETFHAFDREFDRLHLALKNHRPTPVRQREFQHDLLGEEAIERWIESVNKTLTGLRKRRTRRLAEHS